MVLLVPFGSACLVRQSIDKYLNGGRATNLFDWNYTNFKTILDIIKNIDRPFVADEFYDMEKTCLNSHRVIGHKRLSFMILHDFPISKTYDEYMPEFLEKYNRRKLRLKQTILLEKKNIHFIHFLDVNMEHCCIPTLVQVCEFYNAIKSINPDCKAHLHLLVHPDHRDKAAQINTVLVTAYIHVHYMKRIYNCAENITENIAGENWNWNEIYDYIAENNKYWR